MKASIWGLVPPLFILSLLWEGCDWASFTKRAVNPYQGDPASAARGQALYLQLCQECHGPGGEGNGPQAVSLKRPPPDFTDRRHMATRGDADLFWGINRGSRGVMPSFKERLAESETWDLVNYIRSLSPAP